MTQKQIDWYNRSEVLWRISGIGQFGNLDKRKLTAREKEIICQIQELRDEFISSFPENTKELGFNRKCRKVKIFKFK